MSGNRCEVLDLPALTTVGDFVIEQELLLRTLNVPLLATAGNLRLAATALTNLRMLDPTLGVPLQTLGNLTVTRNLALPVCAGVELEKHLRSWPGLLWQGTLDNTLNLTCTCPGTECCSGPVCQ